MLIHADPNPTNVLDGSGGPVLIDWGSAGAGPRACDVAYLQVMAADAARTDPTWQAEALARREALASGQPYRFAAGDGPR